MIKRRVLDLEMMNNGVERAAISHMPELHARDVIGRRIPFLGCREHLVSGNVDELRTWVNEAADQPRASDPVDLRMFARDPPSIDGAGFLARGKETVLPTCDAAF